MKLTLTILRKEAKLFCENENSKEHPDLLGVTDGKAIGTYVEHKFKDYLEEKYEFTAGSSSKGIDFPDDNLNTDIKVTSIQMPQSSCPFKNAHQKIFGLGYNLLVFVYKKEDVGEKCYLKFEHCTFIDASKTGDYRMTKRLREMIQDGAIKEDILGFLEDKNVPGNDFILNQIADKILDHMPEQGYLTITNALQWRLQYKRAIDLDNDVSGVYNYDWV